MVVLPPSPTSSVTRSAELTIASQQSYKIPVWPHHQSSVALPFSRRRTSHRKKSALRLPAQALSRGPRNCTHPPQLHPRLRSNPRNTMDNILRSTRLMPGSNRPRKSPVGTGGIGSLWQL